MALSGLFSIHMRIFPQAQFIVYAISFVMLCFYLLLLSQTTETISFNKHTISH